MSHNEVLRDKFFRADVKKIINQSETIKDLQNRVKIITQFMEIQLAINKNFNKLHPDTENSV